MTGTGRSRRRSRCRRRPPRHRGGRAEPCTARRTGRGVAGRREWASNWPSRGRSARCGARIEATVYRVVQEALTNVHKHAAGAKALVRLAYREAEVAVLVTNGPSDGSP